MRCYVGLDVSLHDTNICIIDEKGRKIREGVAPSEAKAIAAWLRGDRLRFHRVGLEAGAVAIELYHRLAKLRLPVVCIEARHAHKVLSARLNKTDRNDAQGIADLMRTGTFRPVHIKTGASQCASALLTARSLLLVKGRDLQNGIGGVLRAFGLKVRRVKADDYCSHIHSLVSGRPELDDIIEPLLMAWASVRACFGRVEEVIRRQASADPICVRLMTAQGVGPIVAFNYRCVIDEPGRFASSRTVGAYLGLTKRSRETGGVDHGGRISKMGDKRLRAALFNAAAVILNPRTHRSDLRDWGLQIAAKKGMMKAQTAVARRLAVILHHMWIDGVDFRRFASPA